MPTHTGVDPDGFAELLTGLVRAGLRFKGREEIYGDRQEPAAIRRRLLVDLAESSTPLTEVIAEFGRDVLPLCKNEASPRFLGFGDTGDDPAALAGGVLALLTQQNLINQSFDAPSATFVEIAVLRWLRALLGFGNPPAEQVSDVWAVGGVATTGGTTSNAMAMMLARENAEPGCMAAGVSDPERFGVVVPQGLGHYSIRAALPWLGCGNQTIEVPTDGLRYDQAALAVALRRHAGRIMAVVAYAGDSRTQTVERLDAVLQIVRAADPGIWLHADACWGLMCALTDQRRHLIDGITGFDSVTVDPHKVLNVPYTLSALLVRDPAALRMISSYSDLIMQEDFAFGQVTPFLGSRAWSSLKLWMMMRAHGRSGLAAMVDQRLAVTRAFAGAVDAHPRLLRLHDPDLTAVAFVYLPVGFRREDADLTRLNAVNIAIHERMLAEGRWHLHQFSLPDPGHFGGGMLCPLRFVGINPRIEQAHISGVLKHVVELGMAVEIVPLGAGALA
ncbi:pyridoxal phosphate-dependent decarboxylase family protein [Cryptosporangium sp. NPDC048952]|uniref:pyridoxal phosphate-dependent decarboxylase family protein n=1 Tax=Cryptosporangium sp. NPDC048952 TaxID=3363961 RepID=UPI00372047B0